MMPKEDTNAHVDSVSNYRFNTIGERDECTQYRAIPFAAPAETASWHVHAAQEPPGVELAGEPLETPSSLPPTCGSATQVARHMPCWNLKLEQSLQEHHPDVRREECLLVSGGSFSRAST